MTLLDTWRGERCHNNAKAMMGFGGVAIFDDEVDILDMLHAYMQRAAQESCGQCVPCRYGLAHLAERLGDMCHGIGNDDDSTYLKDLATCVQNSARCDIGQTAPQALLDCLENVPHLVKAHQAKKGNYVSLLTAPCMNACPAHVNIPDYIEKIRLRQFEAAFASVMERCPMPATIGRVCEHPCEAACKRGRNGKPLAIRHLKRFLADQCGHLPLAQQAAEPLSRNDTLRKVAIIGAGPAGLSCAYYLLQRGIAVTLFEKHDCAGGMAKFGIPDYRLPPHTLAHEVERVVQAGGIIRYGVDIGKDYTLDAMRADGFEAVFIGTGAPYAPSMPIEGGELNLSNYISGVEYLHEAAQGKCAVQGKSLAVVGGGNVAMDCARTALRQGFEKVYVLYRRTESEMPADPMEVHEAKLEGVIFTFLAAPTKLMHKDGQVCGIICQKMGLGEADASGRRSPVATGEYLELPCDVVIHAIGQKVAVSEVLRLQGDSSCVEHDFTTALGARDTINVDPITGQVHGIPYLFGGGDCATGPKTLIGALAAGRRAASHIYAYLHDLHHLEAQDRALEYTQDALEKTLMPHCLVNAEEGIPSTDHTEPMPVHSLDISKRLQDFAEVEHGSAPYEAMAEAERCLRCFRILMVAP